MQKEGNRTFQFGNLTLMEFLPPFRLRKSERLATLEAASGVAARLDSTNIQYTISSRQRRSRSAPGLTSSMGVRRKLVFTFVRHGETDENAQKILQGSKHTPLNETGREQARRLGARLQKEHLSTAKGRSSSQGQPSGSRTATSHDQEPAFHFVFSSNNPRGIACSPPFPLAQPDPSSLFRQNLERWEISGATRDS
jgi:hypothetical protein